MNAPRGTSIFGRRSRPLRSKDFGGAAPGRWRRITLVAALVCAVIPAAAQAQQRGGRRGPPGAGRADLEQRVRGRFGEMVRQRLGLDDEQSAALAEMMASFQGDRRQLARDEEALRRRVEAAMLEGRGSDDEARSLLERLLDLREREAALFRAEQEALLEVLTPWQLLQFHALREQLNERVRQLRGGRGPGGGDVSGRPGADRGGGRPMTLPGLASPVG